MKIYSIITSLLISVFCLTDLAAQAPVSPPDDDPSRTVPVEPFRIIGNIYYVGTTEQGSSYLVTGSQGHVLFDSEYEESVPVILKNVEKLGFKPEDIKMIVGTHGHDDHIAGHAAMQEATGAQILSSEGDKVVVETGGKGDEVRPGRSWTPAKVDRVIGDGEKITLGDTEITAWLTPGHTKGCMSFTMVAEEEGKKYNVLLLGGVRPSALPLLSQPVYPNQAEDLASSYAKLKKLPVDVYLGAHGYWFDIGEKIKRMKAGEGYKAFIDPEGFRKAIDGWELEFIDNLIKEGKAALAK